MRSPVLLSHTCIVCCITAASWSAAQATTTYRTVYEFSGSPDGAGPMSTLITDVAGNLYGTTTEGGTSDGGAVFVVTPTGVESVLHSFGPQNSARDGVGPQSGVIADADGNLYGTTLQGGGGCGGHGCGVVYRIAPNGTETVLHKFRDKTDGHAPSGGLLADGTGNLYGTTTLGGSGCNKLGCGTVFKISPDGSETLLYSFKGGSDGFLPYSGLIADSSGNLYGTTAGGGGSVCGQLGCGTVYRLSPDGSETVLYSFKGGNDGAAPYAPLIIDSQGNFYGTTSQGGGGCGGTGCGTIFKLAPDGTETILHAFHGGTDGAVPYSSLIMDKLGNLYGTTQQGGGADKRGCFENFGCGTVFELAPDGTETILIAFDPKHVQLPYGGLTATKQGHLYGTTEVSLSHGTLKGGVVFEVKPQ